MVGFGCNKCFGIVESREKTIKTGARIIDPDISSQIATRGFGLFLGLLTGDFLTATANSSRDTNGGRRGLGALRTGHQDS